MGWRRAEPAALRRLTLVNGYTSSSAQSNQQICNCCPLDEHWSEPLC
jgi:hypothetical protein